MSIRGTFEESNNNYIYDRASSTYALTDEASALLKSITAKQVDVSNLDKMLPFADRSQAVFDVANRLSQSVSHLNRSDYKTTPDYTKALLDQYYYDIGEKGKLRSSLEKTAIISEAAKLADPSNQFSLTDFISKKFNLVTIAFVIIGIFLLLTGAKNLSGDAVAQTKRAFK